MEGLHAAHSLPALAALCGSGGPLGTFGLAGVLCAAALVGSFAHCAPMCGPFVLMQLTGHGTGGVGLNKLGPGALPGYHLGRMTTYVALGAVAGGLGGALVGLGPFHWIVALPLTAAAFAFFLQAARLAAPQFAAPLLRTRGLGLAVPLVKLLGIERRIALGGYPLGLVLGLLPCGFLYAALFAAAASGSAAAGAAAMAGFALGTIPALVMVGLLGAQAARRWRGLARRVAAPVFLLNAIILTASALGALA